MKGYKQLTQEQRYTIAQLLKRGASSREIARTIEVSASIISREIKRNGLFRKRPFSFYPVSI